MKSGLGLALQDLRPEVGRRTGMQIKITRGTCSQVGARPEAGALLESRTERAIREDFMDGLTFELGCDI